MAIKCSSVLVECPIVQINFCFASFISSNKNHLHITPNAGKKFYAKERVIAYPFKRPDFFTTLIRI
jgi:hypothetical protein